MRSWQKGSGTEWKHNSVHYMLPTQHKSVCFMKGLIEVIYIYIYMCVYLGHWVALTIRRRLELLNLSVYMDPAECRLHSLLKCWILVKHRSIFPFALSPFNACTPYSIGPACPCRTPRWQWSRTHHIPRDVWNTSRRSCRALPCICAHYSSADWERFLKTDKLSQLYLAAFEEALRTSFIWMKELWGIIMCNFRTLESIFFRLLLLFYLYKKLINNWICSFYRHVPHTWVIICACFSLIEQVKLWRLRLCLSSVCRSWWASAVLLCVHRFGFLQSLALCH